MGKPGSLEVALAWRDTFVVIPLGDVPLRLTVGRVTLRTVTVIFEVVTDPPSASIA